MRIMDNADRRAHIDPLFYDYKILKLFDHVKMENALFLHKHFNHELPQSLIDNFKIEQRNDIYSTRTSRYNTLIVPNINTKNMVNHRLYISQLYHGITFPIIYKTQSYKIQRFFN